MGQWQKGAIVTKKVIKSVSFNPALPEELKMIKAINRKGNYSGYIKKLIAEDLERKDANRKKKGSDRPEPNRTEPDPPEIHHVEPPEIIEPPQTYGERLEQMKRERKQNPSGPNLFI